MAACRSTSQPASCTTGTSPTVRSPNQQARHPASNELLRRASCFSCNESIQTSRSLFFSSSLLPFLPFSFLPLSLLFLTSLSSFLLCTFFLSSDPCLPFPSKPHSRSIFLPHSPTFRLIPLAVGSHSCLSTLTPDPHFACFSAKPISISICRHPRWNDCPPKRVVNLAILFSLSFQR